MRASVDYQHRNGAFAGGSIANTDYLADSRFSENARDSQTIVYAGYNWQRAQWQTNVTVSHYVYPEFERDFDYSQMSVGLSYRDRYFLNLAYSSDYLDLYDRTKIASVGIAQPWIKNLEFSATVGQLSYNGQSPASFSYWDVGLSRPFGQFAVDLRYHDSNFQRNSIAGNQTRNEWVVSMTWSMLPLQQSRGRR